MEIDAIIFEEEKNLIFTEEFFILGKKEEWKISVLLDVTNWD